MTFTATDFAVPGIYLDSAARHPLPLEGAERIVRYGAFLRAHPTAQGLQEKRRDIRALFAALVNVLPNEIAFVSSTTAGEDRVLSAMGLPNAGRGIVTDELHYSQSLNFYKAVRSSGAAVTVVPQSNGRIDYSRLSDAIVSGTALVALSSVSHWNGFKHDLAAVCDLAHARGALVYADIIQEAGAMPMDLRASGVDFAACASYKWLLGDIGLAFLYVRREHFDRLYQTRRATWQEQFAETTDEDAIDAAALFEMGTQGASAVEVLGATLPQLIDGGTASQHAARQPLLAEIDRRTGALPLRPLTPPGTCSPIRAFSGDCITPEMAVRLDRLGVRLTVRHNYLRLSPAIFNTLQDISVAADFLSEIIGTASRRSASHGD